MNFFEFLATTSILATIGSGLGLFFGREMLAAWISKGTQHRFDKNLEQVKADLRETEERLKSLLRDKESEISTLRSTVLSAMSGRQSLLDARRFQAVEKLWMNVNELSGHKFLSSMMAVINIEKLKEQAGDSQFRRFIATMEKTAPDIKMLKNVARDEQPFLSELAWAYFVAYQLIVLTGYTNLLFLKGGLAGAEEFAKSEEIKKTVKAALPDYSAWIDKYDIQHFHLLAAELEKRLLAELRRILEGRDADQADTLRAAAIVQSINEIENDRAKQKVQQEMEIQ